MIMTKFLPKVRLILTAALLIFVSAGPALTYEFEGFVDGEVAGDQFGEALGIVDFNGDGYQDLAVGASANDQAGLSAGKVYLFYGGPTADLSPDLTFTGAASSFFGQAVASPGDLNNDGIDDLVVGAPFYDLPGSSAGAAYLFYGGLSPDTTVDHIFTGEAGGQYFGISIGSAGDFNNDSYPDLIVGAYRADWGSFSRSGKAFVYFGGPSFDFTADLTLIGAADGERFGWAVTSGDFTGDNISDIAVGAYSWDSTEINQGRIYVFSGSASPDSLIDYAISGDAAGLKFGWTLAAGEVTGDAYPDLIMGTDGFQIGGALAGRLYVFDGGPSFDAIWTYTYDRGVAGDLLLGDALAAGVDINQAGAQEILVGVPGDNAGGTGAGSMTTLSGGTSIVTDTTFAGHAANEQLGSAVMLWPDYGGSGAFAVVGGAPGYNSFQGRIHVYSVGEGGSLNQPPQLEAIVGQQVAAGDTMAFSVAATDPDGPSLTLRAENVPPMADFTDHGDGTGDFVWATAPGDTGVVTLRVIAEDGLAADTADVDLSVYGDCCVGLTGNVNNDPLDEVTLTDLTLLVNHLFVTFELLPCPPEANTTGDSEGVLNLTDLTVLVNTLFVTFEATTPCQ